MDASLKSALVAGAASFGVTVDDALAAGLGRYLDLLLFWNRRINLTAVRDPLEIIEKHFIDSLAVLPHLPHEASSLVDAGSGAGFPGAVIALARPALAVTLVEPNRKKAAFLQTLRREIPLPNASILATRIEEVKGRFDVAVSRATWALPEWLVIGARLVSGGGIVIGMEGSERHPLPATCRRVEYSIAGAPRALVLCRAEPPTP